MPTTITIESNQSPTDTSHSQSDFYSDTEGSSGTGVHVVRPRGASANDQYSDELDGSWDSVTSDEIEPSDSASRPPTQNRHRSQDAYTTAPIASSRRHRPTEQASHPPQARRVRRQHAPAPPESSVDPHEEQYPAYGRPYPAPQPTPYAAGMSRPPYAHTHSSYSNPPGAPFGYGAGPGALTQYGGGPNPFPQYAAPPPQHGHPFAPQQLPQPAPGAAYFGAQPMSHHGTPAAYGHEMMPYGGHHAYGGMPGQPQYGALPPHMQPNGMAHHSNFYAGHGYTPASEISTTDPALEKKLLALAEDAKRARKELADRDAKEALAITQLEAAKKAEAAAEAAAKKAAEEKVAWEKRLAEETAAAKKAGEEAARQREIAELEAKKKAEEDRIAYQRKFEAEWAASIAKASEDARKAQEAAAEAAKKAAVEKAAWEKRLAEETAAAKKAGEEAARAAEMAASEAKKKIAEEQAAWQKKLQEELRSQMLKHTEDVKKAEEAAAESAKKAAEEKAAWEKKIEEEKKTALAKGIEQAKKAQEAAEKKAADAAAEAKAKADAIAELAKLKADNLAEQEKLKKEAAEAAKKQKEDAEKALAEATKPRVAPKKPIKFKDAVGRKFNFPFELCKTWAGMDELIQQAFAHVSVVGPAVRAGRFDLIGPNGEMILKAVWESMIEEDWTITMSMWPEPERPHLAHGIPPRPRSRHDHAHGRGPPPQASSRHGPGPGPGPGPGARIPIPPPHGGMYGEIPYRGANPNITPVPDPRGRSSRSPSRTKSKKSSSGGGMLGFLAGGKPGKSSGKGPKKAEQADGCLVM